MNEAIIQLLQPLAETLKTTIYHIWELQLRQVYIDGFHALCVLILGLALIVIPIKRWKALNKILKSDTPIDGISKDDINSLRFGDYAYIIRIYFSIVLFSNCSNVFYESGISCGKRVTCIS